MGLLNNYSVYKHTTPNGKVYIGITKLNPTDRWDYGCGYYSNPHFYNAIKKYGWNNIAHDILASGLTKEEACSLEKELISKYDSTNPVKGYNRSTGGESHSEGFRHTEESKRKIGNANRNPSADTREKISEARKKQTPPMRGKTHSEETRHKLSRSNGYPVRCIETEVVYHSAHEAAREMNVCFQNICAVCRGKKKTAGSYHWEYVRG